MTGKMNQPIRSLVLGKFLPLHKGHVYLLETARRNSDELTIVVCSLSSEPIDGDLRFKWVQDAFPDCNVVHLKDDTIPQEPSEHPDFWNIWKKVLKDFHPEPLDYVFTSEEYGHRLAQELDCKHWMVDLERHTIPVSGTKARTMPMRYWDFLPDHVKGHFVKRVLVTGPESCGKSTMTENLAKHFKTDGIQEWARDWLIDMDFDMDDLNAIAIVQYKLQQRANATANKVWISDTSAIETHVYAKHYLGESSPIIEKYLALQKDNYDLVLLLTPDIPWVNDGLRNLNKVREEMYEKFKGQLEELGIEYHVISGRDFKKRTSRAIDLVNSLIEE
jgi:HTH-type transcriptional repressor of NAD biosynthesis genes